jgi:PAS domain S-box-containing protein
MGDLQELNALPYRTYLSDSGRLCFDFGRPDIEALLEMSVAELEDALITKSLPISGVDIEQFYHSVWESQQHATPWEAEFCFTTPKTQTEVWLRMMDSPRFDQNGSLSFSGVIMNMTPFRKANVQQQKTLRRLQSHLNNSPLGVVEWNGAGLILRWAGAAERIFGWSASEAEGRTLESLQFVHPDDAERVWSQLSHLQSGKSTSAICLNRNVTKDGSIIHVKWHNSAVLGASGEIETFLSFAEEITHQVETERALQNTLLQLKAVLTSSRMLAWEAFEDSDVVIHSEPLSQFYRFGSLGQQCTRRESLKMVHPDDWPLVTTQLEEALAAHEEYICFFRSARPTYNHKPDYYRLIANRITGHDGTQTRILGMVVDETERHYEHLENCLLNAQVEEAQRYNSLGLLAGRLAHDFNNLLTVIWGFASYTKETASDTTTIVQNMVEIEKACERAAALCQQVSSFAGASSLSAMTFDPVSTFQQFETTLQKDASPHVIVFDVPDNLPTAVGEFFQVSQMVRALVRNAAQACVPGSGKIHFRVIERRFDSADIASQAFRLRPAPGEYLEISCQDNGAGMTDEVLAKAFEPFFSTYPGQAGLGLSSVHGLLRSLQGGLSISTAPGAGTLIAVYLPLAQPASLTDRTPVAGELKSHVQPRTAPEKPTVLVVDDEPTICELVLKTLQPRGASTLVAVSGEAALKLVAHQPPLDLVILDLMMPGMNGREVLSALRQQYPTLPAIIMSGYTDKLVSLEEVQSAPTIVVQKPFQLDAMSQHVRTLLPRGSKT